MRPNLAILTTCAVLILVFAGCGEHGTEPEIHGAIDCVSWPHGAAIWLDGTDTGKVTDALITNVGFGNHVVTFTIHGYCAYAETVTVSSSTNPVKVYRFLEHRPGILRVQSNPPDALITINGSSRSLTTPAIIPGVPLDLYDQCDVYLRLPGYYPHFETVALAGDDTTTVSAEFEPCPDIDLTQVRGDTLLLLKADGLIQRVLATGLTNLGSYQVSPSGQYVAYLSLVGISTVTSIVNWDGSLRANLQFGAADGAWSNSGDQLVFGAYVDGIYLYDAPSNTTCKIYQTQGFVYDHNPTFSPGDSLIAFVNHSNGTNAVIRVMRVDGSDAHSVSPYFTTRHNEDLNLCWVAPDLILWADNDGINYVNPLTGTISKVVTTTYLTSLTYSPDRTRYAFSEAGNQPGLYLGTVGQWDRRRLPDTYADAPRWLPGNDRLQYWGDGHLKLAFWDGTTHIIAP